MNLFQALILGVVQGLTEFLPVSSSAHLVYVQHLLGFREPLLLFDVVVHLGTLVSLFIYFSGDIAGLLRDSLYGISFLIRRKPLREIFEIAPRARWALGILTASLPTGIMGFLFKGWFETLFGSVRASGIALFGTSLILWSTRYFRAGEKEIGNARWLDFLAIGTLQGAAILPGISRSGTTIAAALFFGLTREAAFRFSFLLAIPAILGAGILELKEGAAAWNHSWPVFAAGFFTAAFFGYLSLHFISRVLRRGKLHRFAFYTLAAALLLSS